MAAIHPHRIESADANAEAKPQAINAVFKPEEAMQFTQGMNRQVATASDRLSQGDNAILPKFENVAFLFGKKDESESSGRLTDFQRRVLSGAENMQGEKLWQKTPYKDIVADGDAGCAAALGYFLNRQGIRVETSPLANGLKNNLLSAGWKRAGNDVQHAEVGSVIYGGKKGRDAAAGGGAAHIAVVVGNRDGVIMVADNNSKQGGRWDIRPLSESFKPSLYNYSTLQVLKPPGARR